MKNILAFQLYQKDPQKFAWRQMTEANKWKKSGFPIEVTLFYAQLEHQQMKLSSNSHFHQKLEENSFKQKEAQAEIDDIHSHYEHFVNSEKITLSDQIFARIDTLFASLKGLKSRAKEQKKYMPNIKNK